jgi:hypothetical protein
VIAGVPYYCAEGQLQHATGRCLFHGSPIPVEALQATARRWAEVLGAWANKVSPA